jgi:prophage endopeptidase
MTGPATHLLRLLLVAAIGGVLWWSHHTGVDAGRNAVLADWSAERARAAQAAAATTDQALRDSAALGETLQRLIADNQKAKTRDDQALSALLADVRAGAVRLSIPTARPAATADAGLPGAAAAAPVAARTDIAPEAAAALVAIATDGDDAIRDLGTCLDAYGLAQARMSDAQTQAPRP